MKRLGLSAVCAGAFVALVVAVGGASAADGSAYMSKCKENAASAQLPEGVTKDDVVSFCSCMVDEVGDNQSALDEMTDFESLSPEERMQRMQNGDPPSKPVQDAFQSCAPEGMGPPPQQ